MRRFNLKHPILPLTGLAALLAATSGCNVVGALAYKLTPEMNVDPKYNLKREAPLVVLVENYRSPDLNANDAELLARTLQAKLEEKNVVDKLIKTEKILDLRNNRPKDFTKMSVPAIAQAVGAEQVLYVDLQSSGIGSMTGSSMFQGKAFAMIKLIDAKTGATLYPPDSVDGIGVGYETNIRKGREEGSYASVRSDLFDGLAKNIGRHFYKWKPSEDEE